MGLRRMLICVFAVSLGCAELSQTSDSKAATAPNAPPAREALDGVVLTVNKGSINSAVGISGNKFFVDRGPNRTLSSDILSRIESQISDILIPLGYERTFTQRKANLTVYIGSSRNIEFPKSLFSDMKAFSGMESLSDLNDSQWKISRKTTVSKGGKFTQKSFSTVSSSQAIFFIKVYGHEYGKRPKTLSWLTVYSPSTQWSGYVEPLERQLLKEYRFLFKAPPDNPVTMKGDPACVPRFGYELDGSRTTITKVPNPSPASRAGLKVGDKLLAIDSLPASQKVSDEIYENFLTVPIKVRRGNEIVRSQIKAEIMCL